MPPCRHSAKPWKQNTVSKKLRWGGEVLPTPIKKHSKNLCKTIWALQTYDLVYIMTKGGPMGATEFIAYYIQKTSFKFLKFGYGSAMSYTVSMICFALTYVYIKVFMGNDDAQKKPFRRRRRKELEVK